MVRFVVTFGRSFPLRTKILGLCLGCTLAALGLQTWFFSTSAASLLFRMEQEASQKALGRLQDELYQWIKGYENNLISVYNQADLMTFLAAGASDNEGRRRQSRVAYTLMQTVFSPTQYVSALYLYTLDHRLVSYSRIASTPRYNFPEDIFTDPRANRTEGVSSYVASDNRVMLVTSVYNKSRGQSLIRFVLKIYTNNVRTKIGFLVCDVDLKAITRIIEKYVYSDRQLVWLQPRGDDPLLVFGSRQSPSGTEFLRIADRIREGDWTNPPGMRVGNSVFLATDQQKYNLTAYSLVPQAFLEESRNVLLGNLLLIALLLVVVAVITVTLVTRTLTGPLTRIVGQLGRIEGGETDLRLEHLGNDEIGVLGQGINTMLDRIRDLIAEEYHTEIQLKHAEYKALQAQVNPHFLFNTLETMAGIALTEKGPLVAELCRKMSQLFRYSLDMKDPLATVADELDHLTNYLYVMNLRTQGSLEVEVEVDEALRGTRVPRLSLQPLVENSIQHGLKHRRGAKRLRISAGCRDGKVALQVADNGTGMDADRINARLKETPLGVTEQNASIGIGNIHARISLLFGPPFGVVVESTAGVGTTVTLWVPGPGPKDGSP